MRVLYLHPFSAYGGATKSLAEMVAAFPPDAVDGTALSPQGAAFASLTAAGLKVLPVRGIAQWDDTRFGHYRGLRWLILLRELAYWPGTILALRRIASRQSFDLIHCNEVTAAMAGVVAKRLLGAPLVVHVRSLQQGESGGWISARLTAMLRRNADAIVAIDEAVRRTLPEDLRVLIVHNGMRVGAGSLSHADAARPLQVAIIGVLHRSKGVYELLAAARLLRERGRAFKILVVGENIRPMQGLKGWLLQKLDFARDVRAELEAYVAQNRLESFVEFTGFVPDIRSVYARIDAVCFPSHLDAPGRPVLEAALFGLPSIVAMRNPTHDVIVPGRTGLCIDAPTPEAIADAIETLAADRDACRRMGEEARRMSLSRFDSAVTASHMMAVYRGVCQARAAQGAAA